MKPLINKKITYSKYFMASCIQTIKSCFCYSFFLFLVGKLIWLVEMGFELTWGQLVMAFYDHFNYTF